MPTSKLNRGSRKWQRRSTRHSSKLQQVKLTLVLVSSGATPTLLQQPLWCSVTDNIACMQEGALHSRHSRHSSHRVSRVLTGTPTAMQTHLPRQDLPNTGNSGLRARIQPPAGGTMVRQPLGLAAHWGLLLGL